MITAPSTSAPPTYPRTSKTAEPFGVDRATDSSCAGRPSNRVGPSCLRQLSGLRRREDLLLNQAGQLGLKSVHHHILARQCGW